MTREWSGGRRNLVAVVLGGILAGGPIAGAQSVVFPSAGVVSESVGMVDSEVAWEWYRGSGVVARDPRLIFSCAHIFYDRGMWATDYVFHRAYHARGEPLPSEGASPRGLHYFSSYVDASTRRGSESDLAFASDFTVLYGNKSFGPAVPHLASAGVALRSDRQKRIVGYPSLIDYTGGRGFAYQHSTPWFSKRAQRIERGFHEFDGVSTGPGNSGGPIFVRGSDGADVLAGILVSGTDTTAGVVALDSSTETLSGMALGLEERVREFSNKVPLRITDGGRTFSVVPIRVSGFSGTVSSIKLQMSVRTSRRSDLEVYLRSPGGRIHWISKRAGRGSDLKIKGADLSKSFRGRPANGVWQIWIRDSVRGKRATFERASLRIRAF